mgnify:CR=1 FL=1
MLQQKKKFFFQGFSSKSQLTKIKEINLYKYFKRACFVFSRAAVTVALDFELGVDIRPVGQLVLVGALAAAHCDNAFPDAVGYDPSDPG